MSALLQGVPLMQGGQSLLHVTIGSGIPDHWHNGIPYEADGSVATASVVPDHYHQGLPFSAEGRLCHVPQGPNYFGSGAAPFNTASPGRLNITTGGGIDHYSSGVGYNSIGRMRIQEGAPP